MSNDDPDLIATTLLRAASLSVPPADLQDVVAPYAEFRAKTDALWFPETRYAEPVLIFSAEPPETT